MNIRRASTEPTRFRRLRLPARVGLTLAVAFSATQCRQQKMTEDEKADLLLDTLDTQSNSPPAPQEFPPGIKTIPGLRNAQMTHSPEFSSMLVATKTLSEEVLAYYEKAFADAGWQPYPEESQPDEGYHAYRNPADGSWASLYIQRHDRTSLTMIMFGFVPT